MISMTRACFVTVGFVALAASGLSCTSTLVSESNGGSTSAAHGSSTGSVMGSPGGGSANGGGGGGGAATAGQGGSGGTGTSGNGGSGGSGGGSGPSGPSGSGGDGNGGSGTSGPSGAGGGAGGGGGGGAGLSCGADQQACNGVCTVTMGDDNENCGGCNVVCNKDAKCEAGGDWVYTTCKAGSCAPVTGHCAPYRCDQTTMDTCLTSCVAGSPTAGCLDSHYCDSSNKCEPQKANGSACTKDVECLSNDCKSGKCS